MIASDVLNDLSVYRFLQRIPAGRSYVVRLICLCFIGTHLPLVAALLYVMSGQDGSLESQLPGLGLILMATLFGMLVTLFGVSRALRPVTLASQALRAYVDDRTLPKLPAHFDDEAGELMASVQTVTVRLERLLRQQEQLAQTDPLTSLPNRRAFFERAHGDIRRARETKTPLCLLLFDIDRFKSINDTYGHPVGDKVIKEIAKLLAGLLEPEALAARLGGEEFAILLPGSSTQDAFAKAEWLRMIVSKVHFPELDGRGVSVSGGIATLNADDVVVDPVLERADHALYEAKESGRNCVRLNAA